MYDSIGVFKKRRVRIWKGNSFFPNCGTDRVALVDGLRVSRDNFATAYLGGRSKKCVFPPLKLHFLALNVSKNCPLSEKLPKVRQSSYITIVQYLFVFSVVPYSVIFQSYFSETQNDHVL